MTVKTFPNIFEPIIKPTLKKANFGPNIFVRLKEMINSNNSSIAIKSLLFLIILDLQILS